MSLSFSSSSGSFEDRWIIYATALDCVQHHLERGMPSERFSGFHSISLAMGRGNVRVDAKSLRVEIEAIRHGLYWLPITELAISLRTQAVVSLRRPPARTEETMLVTEWTQSPLDLIGARTLEDLFGHFIDALWSVSSGSATTVHVRDQ